MKIPPEEFKNIKDLIKSNKCENVLLGASLMRNTYKCYWMDISSTIVSCFYDGKKELNDFSINIKEFRIDCFDQRPVGMGHSMKKVNIDYGIEPEITFKINIIRNTEKRKELFSESHPIFSKAEFMIILMEMVYKLIKYNIRL